MLHGSTEQVYALPSEQDDRLTEFLCLALPLNNASGAVDTFSGLSARKQDAVRKNMVECIVHSAGALGGLVVFDFAGTESNTWGRKCKAGPSKQWLCSFSS